LRWYYELPLRLRSLFRKDRVELDLSSELQFHLQNQIDEYVKHGTNPLHTGRPSQIRASKLGGPGRTEEKNTWLKIRSRIGRYFCAQSQSELKRRRVIARSG